MDKSGSYNHKAINKNKHKIIKEAKEALKKKEDMLKHPEKYKKDHEGTGALIGAGLGTAAGVYLGHRLKKKLEK